MKKNVKTILGIALISGIISIAFLVAPILAYPNGTGKGDSLQEQDRDRDALRTRDHVRNRLGTQDCGSICECSQEQSRIRERTNRRIMERICNCTSDSRQLRHLFRNRNRPRNLQP